MSEALVSAFTHKRFPVVKVFSFLFAILLFCLLAACFFGAVALPFGDFNVQHELIFFELRLPRALLAALVGANLAFCGTLSQGLFRNALADPSLIGVTAGASLGASLVIVGILQLAPASWHLGLSLSHSGASLVSLGAFFGGLIAVVFVYKLAQQLQPGSVLTMLLVGIALTAFTSAINGLLDFYADSEQLRRMSLWRMGGLQGADYFSVYIAAFVLFILFLAYRFYALPLNAFLLGESEARHLGIEVEKIKKHLIIFIALGTGTAVALAGTIAFIGLIVPHVLRILVGPNHRVLLPASALGGAILLSLADTFSRSIFAPTELPVGLLTALLGAPFFILLLRRGHHA